MALFCRSFCWKYFNNRLRSKIDPPGGSNRKPDRNHQKDRTDQ